MKPPPPENQFCGGSLLNKDINRPSAFAQGRLRTRSYTKVPICRLPLCDFASCVVKGLPVLYFFSLMSTEACVFSQVMVRVQLPPIEASAMVKFSTGADVDETFMSTRASSSASYL
jgi:hypothetical protein